MAGWNARLRVKGALVLAVAIGALGCEKAPAPAVKSSVSTSPASSAWKPPSDAELPKPGPLRASIERGRALLAHTPDSLSAYVGGNLRCTSCHLDNAMRPYGIPLTAVQARFPKYMDRTGAVIALADRVNYCFTRSMAGRSIPTNSREMTDILAYLAFISRGAPADGHVDGLGMGELPKMQGDTVRGKALFTEKCQVCHTESGGGSAVVPALWGPNSYSVGASMARLERAASFIRHNMPLGQGGTLTDQQAYDLSAYINSHVRPDSPAKEEDWPDGGAPWDVPYSTHGHTAFNPPKVIARTNAEGMIVPKPPSIVAARGR